jgi:SAM-dependent methyltransferase
MNDFDYSIYYSRFHDDSDAHAEKMADWLLGVLKPSVPTDRSAHILDVGCGYGFALRALRRLGFYNLKGLEVSSQQAERCRKAGFDIEVCANSTEWISVNAQQFDYVVLLDVIEHVPITEQIVLLRAIYRCLRPGGRLIITTPNANAILANRWQYNDYTHHSSFTEHSLYFILKNGGFETVQIDATKGIGRFPRRIWKSDNWPVIRKWIVRWCWLQVFKAEIPWERLDEISFELNLTAIATKA